MSEYEYYEFQSLDRRLTATEMAKLRAASTRARITATSFVNEYQWGGGFRGDEDAWMKKYFDAFLYFANWGTRVLKLRVSAQLLDPATAKRYCEGESSFVRESQGNTIVTWISDNEDEEDEEWPDESDALAAMIPIREQLARGDLRSLYLAWLHRAQRGELDEEAMEPPVPAGLRKLDGSLERMVDFLRIDTDLLDVAAAASASMSVQALTRKEIGTWIAGQSGKDKDDYLERFIAGDEPALAAELRRVIEGRAGVVSGTTRTAGALLHAAREASAERRRIEEERAAAQRKRHEKAKALARSKYLAELATREPAVWVNIAALIATKQPQSYDQAVTLLADLRDVAVLHGRESTFLGLLGALRLEHARKPSLLERMDRAGLR